MKDWIKNLLTDEEKLKYVKFGIFPLIAVILTIVIVVVDKPVTQAKELATTQAPVETTQANLLEDEAITKAAAPLKENDIPELQTLMETYFQARLTADPELLRQVFDSTSMGEDGELIERMSQQTEHIESYQNIVCYTKEGLEADSCIIFVKFDIKFFKTETLAPSLLWCYAVKGSDGSYKITDALDEKTSQYIAEAEKTDDVRELSSSVNTALESAIAADGKLASIYNILRTGLTDSSAQSTEETRLDVELTNEEDTSEPSQETTAAQETTSDVTAPTETTSASQ